MADFDAVLREGGERDVPAAERRFNDPRRKISPGFLRTVLGGEPFRSAIPYEGVRISGAVFDDGVELRDLVADRVVGIFDSVVRGPAMLNRMRTVTSVSFVGSTFERKLWLDSAEIGGDLALTQGTYGEIELKTVRVGAELSLSESHVGGRLNLNGGAVGGDLFFVDGRYASVDLRGATVGRQLNTAGSTFTGDLDMGSISVGRSLLMNGHATFAAVNLLGADIGGQISLSESHLQQTLNGEAITVEQDIILSDAEFEAPARLVGARVNGSVEASGTTLRGLNLAGAVIGGELVLGSAGRPVRWLSYREVEGETRRPWLLLWNTSAGGLIDDAESWPESLAIEIRDFRYERLTQVGGSASGTAGLRPLAWYVAWLEQDASYSFQPYKQLATVLAGYGKYRMANAILFAGRERERAELPWYSPRSWWLFVLRWTIRYGYGLGEFLALGWALVLVLLGWFVARKNGLRKAGKSGPGFWYSVDMMVPGIELSRAHAEVEIEGWGRYFFYFQRLAGPALLLLVAGGVAGLTG